MTWCCVLDGGLGEVVDVVGEEDAEEEPAEAGAVDDDDPRRHGRPGGGGGRRRRDPRVRVVRGAEAAGPCTHLTLTRRELYVVATSDTTIRVVAGR